MKLNFKPYTLQLRDVFTLATSSRTETPVVLVELSDGELTGYGEASLPPYLPETQSSVMRFLSELDLSRFTADTPLDELLGYTAAAALDNCAAKAAVDIAWHDLKGKRLGQPWWKIWKLDIAKVPDTSYTIGIDTPDEIRRKTLGADSFNLLKVKLGRDTDKMIIETIRSVTDKPICIDVNQGWTDKYQALDMLHWCADRGVIFAEQPMPKVQPDDMAWVTERSPLPTVADESCQRLSDLEQVKGIFSGINIKLMKCSGMDEAYRMIAKARSYDLKVMLGCMTETSCAISAAAQLSPLVDWTDLDGNQLITNDCFDGARLVEGKVIPTDNSGIGISKREIKG